MFSYLTYEIIIPFECVLRIITLLKFWYIFNIYVKVYSRNFPLFLDLTYDYLILTLTFLSDFDNFTFIFQFVNGET